MSPGGDWPYRGYGYGGLGELTKQGNDGSFSPFWEYAGTLDYHGGMWDHMGSYSLPHYTTQEN